MNAALESKTPRHTQHDAESPPCFVLLAFEDDATRDHAQHVIDHLVEALWSEVGFEFIWWNLKRLTDEDVFRQSCRDAVKADIILISLHSSSTVDESAVSWTESWLAAKQDSASLLVALIGTEGDERKGFTPMHVQLRNLASRAHMDFLPLVLHPAIDHETSSLERLFQRATESSPVLDSILGYHPPPSEAGWGIND